MIGIDLTSVARFKAMLVPGKRYRVEKFFTAREIAYGKQYKDAAPHFAGMFAAKEAASKALGVTQYPYFELEVRHRESGAPEVWKRGRRVPVAISITHEGGFAAAVALKYEKMAR